MSKKKAIKGKDTTEEMGKRISHRTATEEDYKKMNYWNVGTFHRASTMPETEASSGEDKSQEKAPQNPEELVEALRKRGFKINVMSSEQLEARRQADLEMEAWHGKHPKK